MIGREVFYERLEKHCKLCSEWDGVCLRGHDLRSPTGCPLRNFEPVLAADYDADNGRSVSPKGEGGCPGCSAKPSSDSVPDMTWPQVLLHFAEAMFNWTKAGMPLVSADKHEERYAICQACPQIRNFYCNKCKCIVYTKAKLLTELCPLSLW